MVGGSLGHLLITARVLAVHIRIHGGSALLGALSRASGFAGGGSFR